MKKEKCLACVLHIRTPLKEVMPPLIAARDKALTKGYKVDSDEMIDSAWDEFYRKLESLSIGYTDPEDLYDSLNAGMWDLYISNGEYDEVCIYVQELV